MSFNNDGMLADRKCIGMISRKEAINLGAEVYFTGNPCKKGHVTYRYVTSRHCRQCQQESNNFKSYGQKPDQKSVSVRRAIEERSKKIDEYDFDL